jgi:hypothetical protein
MPYTVSSRHKEVNICFYHRKEDHLFVENRATSSCPGSGDTHTLPSVQTAHITVLILFIGDERRGVHCGPVKSAAASPIAVPARRSADWLRWASYGSNPRKTPLISAKTRTLWMSPCEPLGEM